MAIRNYILLVVMMVFGAFNSNAQNYPVQANLSITPPYSVYLQDYISPGVDKLNLNILPTDFNISELRVKLRVSIEGQSVTLRTKPSFQPSPLYINGGVPLRLTGYDLAEYFNPDNLDFQGISKQQFLQNGALPEGVYRFNVEILEFNRNVVISNKAFVVAWIILNDPPLINLPFNGEKVRATDPQNVIFQWTPRHTGSPNSAFATEYEFTLVEIWPEGRNPDIAIRSTNPIYQTTTQSTTLVYGIAEPALVPGRSYAFRVRAKSIVGIDELDLFKNGGYSQTGTFIFGDECKAPTGIESNNISTKSFNAKWNSAFNHTGFNVRYRESGGRANTWYEEETFIGEQRIGELKPETAYEVQVRASCGSLESPFSESLVVTTDEEGEIAFSCGVPPETYGLENREPLQNLFIGDYIYANDFDIKVREVAGSNGVFSGTGVAEMPLFSLAKVRVKFEGISVNTDFRLVDGVVTTIYDPNSSLMVDLDPEDTLEEGDTDGENDGTGEEDIVVDADGDITFDEPIDSVYVADNGDIVVVLEGGGTQTVTPPTGEGEGEETEDTHITDSEGNTWTVDNEGNVTPGSGNGSNTPDGTSETDSVLFVQKELIKEVLEHYKVEINLWFENNGKGPLEEAFIQRLMAMPDCLPEEESKLEAVLAKIEEYLENPEALLELVKEDDANKVRIEELTTKLTGNQPPYATELSETEWDELLQMLCPYLVEEEERPELVTIDPITDDQFAAGINDDKLKITYSIKTTEKYPLQYAKLEVYKNDGTLAYVKSEGLEIGEEKQFQWNGQVNQNVPEGEKVYIRSDESPFTIKIIASTNQDFADPFQTETQGSVHPDVDAFLDNYDVAKYIEASSDMGKFEYYQQLATFMYDEVTSDQTDEQVLRNFNNALDYLGDQVKEHAFLGRKVIVHDNYWVYLQDIESNLGSSYVNHPDYTMGGFSIRFQRNSTDQVSNHAYGMALDVNWQRNPYLSKGQLYFLQLLTDFKFYQNPSNPEDLKEAHDQLIGFGYQQADITSMKAGFEHLNQSSLKTENFETLLNETLSSYRSAAATFSQLVSRNTHLRNEVHFFNQKSPQEIAEIERQLFEELPAEADALLETIKAIKSTEEINRLYDLYNEGYLKAFLLDKHKADENTALLVALDNLKGLFGFEAAITSLKEACQQPENENYTYWVTNVTITQPQSIPEVSTYQGVGTFIESREVDYKEIFYSTSSYSGIIGVLNNSAITLAQNGFMLMSAEFAREFLDTSNGDIGWGGNWKRLKDFMHLELVADNKFSISN